MSNLLQFTSIVSLPALATMSASQVVAQIRAERPTVPAPRPEPPTLATILSNRLAQLAADLRDGRLTVPATAAALATLIAACST